MAGHCSFNSAWLKHDSYKDWLVLDKTKPSSTAQCKICPTTFNVSNMGEAAVKSYMKGAKHSQFFKQVTTPVSVKDDTSSEHKKTFNNIITVVCIILLFLVCRAICSMLFKINVV
jgi:hypothetical protein